MTARALIPLLFTLPLAAQFQVSMVPESLASSQAIFGKGRDVGRWFVQMCSDYTASRTIDRTRVLRQFPDIHVLPARETEDQLTRKAAADKRSVIGNTGDAILAVAGGGTALGGLVAGSRQAQYVGWGITALQVGLQLFKKAHAPPNPQPYLTDMLPDQISLDAGKCLPDKWVVASLVHNAHTEQATIFLPGDPVAAQPTPKPVAQVPPIPACTISCATCTPEQDKAICDLENPARATVAPWGEPFSLLPLINMSTVVWGF